MEQLKPPRIPTGFLLLVSLVVLLVLAAVCAVGVSAALGAPKPTSSTSTRSTP